MHKDDALRGCPKRQIVRQGIKTMAKTPITEKTRLTLKDLLQKHGLYTVACRQCTKKADVEDLMGALFTAITAEIAAGNEVQIYGFGKFSPKTYAGRSQRSGLPGVKGGVATFGDVKLMKFKLSPMSKDVLNGRERPESKRGKKATSEAAAPAKKAAKKGGKRGAKKGNKAAPAPAVVASEPAVAPTA